MRRSLILAAALALAGATHASAADTVSHQMHMQADVPSVCSFSALTGSASLTGVSAASSTFLVEIDDALARVGTQQEATLTFAEAFCNSISTIELKRDGFKHVGHASQTGLPLSVRNEIDYEAWVMWGDGPPVVSLDASINEAEDNNVGPRSAALHLQISVPVGTKTLVAGNYADTLTLTVNPNN